MRIGVKVSIVVAATFVVAAAAVYAITGYIVLGSFRQLDDVVHAQRIDIETEEEQTISDVFLEEIAVRSRLFQHADTKDGKSEIVLFSEGPALVAAHPISDSKHNPPIHGTLIVGRFLNDSAIAEISETARYSVRVVSVNNPDWPDDFRWAHSQLSEEEPIVVQELENEIIAEVLRNLANGFEYDALLVLLADGKEDRG